LTEPRVFGQAQFGQERQGLRGTWLGFAWSAVRVARPTARQKSRIEIARIIKRQGSILGAFSASVVMENRIA